MALDETFVGQVFPTVAGSDEFGQFVTVTLPDGRAVRKYMSADIWVMPPFMRVSALDPDRESYLLVNAWTPEG